MEIVKFSNGQFGILEKGFFWEQKKFIDLESPRSARKIRDAYFRDCVGDLDKVKEVYERLNLTYERLKNPPLSDYL